MAPVSPKFAPTVPARVSSTPAEGGAKADAAPAAPEQTLPTFGSAAPAFSNAALERLAEGAASDTLKDITGNPEKNLGYNPSFNPERPSIPAHRLSAYGATYAAALGPAEGAAVPQAPTTAAQAATATAGATSPLPPLPKNYRAPKPDAATPRGMSPPATVAKYSGATTATRPSPSKMQASPKKPAKPATGTPTKPPADTKPGTTDPTKPADGDGKAKRAPKIYAGIDPSNIKDSDGWEHVEKLAQTLEEIDGFLKDPGAKKWTDWKLSQSEGKENRPDILEKTAELLTLGKHKASSVRGPVKKAKEALAKYVADNPNATPDEVKKATDKLVTQLTANVIFEQGFNASFDASMEKLFEKQPDKKGWV